MKTVSFFRRTFVHLLAIFALPLAALAGSDSPGSVYTLSNAVEANRVLAFSRDAHGELQTTGSYPTGGHGTGAGLGSQGALALTNDGRWLVAVNAGSNNVSVFSVRPDSLVLADIVPSGGLRPISVTVADNLVYVLNAGGGVGSSDNISGFFLTQDGRLVALPGSTQALSAANVGPAQISFGLKGDVLFVTEKSTNRIDGFAVDDNGRAGPVMSTPSVGAVPFGFAISSKGGLYVSEAAASALSSYIIKADGSAQVVTPSLINHQAAACWVALSKDERYAYTANAASNTISAYRIGHDGSLSLLDATGFTAAATHPFDLTTSNDGRFLYALTTGAIRVYRVAPDGHLTEVASISGIPAGNAGLVAR